jgi:hypothetical protein
MSVSQAIINLLTTDRKRIYEQVDALFTEDAVFEHPLFVVRGRQMIKTVYLAWSHFNASFDILHCQVSEVKQNVQYVAIEYRFMPKWLPWFSKTVFVLAQLELVPDSGSDMKWRIKKQHDFIQWDEVMYLFVLPPFDGIVKKVCDVVRHLVGLCLVFWTVAFASWID